ncbi:hypothetical protein NP493_713g00000 [Ridgeia piscesae]|uniref:EGF-like domain-containing protein n=1 Tax=Ridgeia piscesae TaxID=27915 RepID=A0AAD9KQ89_RIDPI|nr:hypothetical protein NP493_713g00000 [Ridgeia piscesae]
MSEDRLKDVDECQYDVSPCRDDSVCHNYIGSYLCICGPQFYYRNDRCTPCSGACPEGQFESQPCSESSDRICSVFRVNASSNVFLEPLFGARDLETTPHYITNNKQMIDFFWFRESGMRISIGVEDINILPLYEDVTYESDNNFMLNYPNTEKEKDHFQKIISHHCRNPIPDYYSLTLEISRDRSTKAKNIICNSGDPSRPRCPDNYADGDTYIHRSLNDACTKMGAFPEVFHGAANSIVCLHETSMLHDIFNQTAPPVRSIRFAPKRCRTSIAKCEQCLTSQRCQLLGDAYRYTIEPMFKKLSEQFQCHIRYRSPATFYRVWFYITVPGTDFETPRRYHTVHANDVPSLGSAFHAVDFITVEHYTGVQLHDDFILIGQEDPGLLNRINFTVQPKKSAADYQMVKPSVHKISNTVFVSSIQFDEPFAYSTSKWVRGRQCDKDMSRITAMQPHYENISQAVKVVADNMAEPYTYLLSSATSRSYMRLFVPGNTSILSWFFHETGPVLLTDASLSSNLTINDDHTAWTINIEGITQSHTRIIPTLNKICIQLCHVITRIGSNAVSHVPQISAAGGKWVLHLIIML